LHNELILRNEIINILKEGLGLSKEEYREVLNYSVETCKNRFKKAHPRINKCIKGDE
jgi:DNA-directed RNA polymerase specialized sigma24 family protein